VLKSEFVLKNSADFKVNPVLIPNRRFYNGNKQVAATADKRDMVLP
jgi:hypothetical protein